MRPLPLARQPSRAFVLLLFLSILVQLSARPDAWAPTPQSRYIRTKVCETSLNCTDLEKCEEGRCVCRWGESSAGGDCPYCPEMKDCNTCVLCSVSGCICAESIAYCTCLAPDEFVQAAQMVLGAGLVFVFSALTVLLCKSYVRRCRWRAQRYSDYMDDNTSLNSVQRWVISRLRDRPPRYEENAPAPSVDKPPAYSSETDTQTQTAYGEAPPPYSSVVGIPLSAQERRLSHDELQSSPQTNQDTNTVQGATNLAFRMDEETPPSSPERNIDRTPEDRRPANRKDTVMVSTILPVVTESQS